MPLLLVNIIIKFTTYFSLFLPLKKIISEKTIPKEIPKLLVKILNKSILEGLIM